MVSRDDVCDISIVLCIITHEDIQKKYASYSWRDVCLYFIIGQICVTVVVYKNYFVSLDEISHSTIFQLYHFGGLGLKVMVIMVRIRVSARVIVRGSVVVSRC